MNKLTTEQKKQFSEIFENISKALDISESRHNQLVQSYEAVGEYLRNDEFLSMYNPSIHPQGSFLLGTMVKPIHDDDDLDIDLVCEFRKKKDCWTAKDLKQSVGNCLKKSTRYRKLLDKEGKRCWTLLYRKESDNPQDKYHLDILPAIHSHAQSIRESYSSTSIIELDKLSFFITDNTIPGYESERDINKWMKSNPFGYAKWFANRCSLYGSNVQLLREGKIHSVPKYDSVKTPLQRIIQILKRHRDLMFDGDENKPISIIITTLAAQSYNGERDLLDGLFNVIMTMENFIEEGPDHNKVVRNPVNKDENFADKWRDCSQKRKNFYDWISRLKQDLPMILQSVGMECVSESLTRCFGATPVKVALERIGIDKRKCITEGQVKVAGTGVLGLVGSTVKAHNFYGK